MKRIVGIAGAALLALTLLAPVALAADPVLPQTGRVLISTGGDVTLPAGDQADAVVVVRGTATINGQANTVVVVDGAALFEGATVDTIVAIRSPVTVGSGTTVEGDIMKLDSAVTQTGDAKVVGSVRDLGLDLAGLGFVLAPAIILMWLGFLLAAIVAGLLVAALAARQVRAAEALISHEPVAVLVTGIVGVFVPIVLFVALAVTIVGLPLAFGVLFALWPFVAFLGYIVTGIWIGDWILGRTSPGAVHERPYLAAVIGLLVLQILGIWPFLSAIASLFGYGAVLLLAWRVFRHHGVSETPMTHPAPSPTPA